ncbi:MAG: HypC/HybG/HupF family hydrogenase formation chaperone [Pseudomonadota bacterium]
MCLGIPGQITAITDPERLMAQVDVSGVKREVNVACVAGNRPLEELIGTWALIHVGFAMSAIDAEEAAKTLEALRELGEAQEEIEAMQASNAMLAGEGA